MGTTTLKTTTTTSLANGQVVTTTNSNEYTRVEYATVGVGNNVVAWYNLTGGMNEVDVVGGRNYTGNGTRNLPFISTTALPSRGS